MRTERAGQASPVPVRNSTGDSAVRRRKWITRGAAVAAAVAVVPLVAVVRQDAYAADTVSCAAQGQIFVAATTGQFSRYAVTSPGLATSKHGTPAAIGSGWQQFGRVIGGPGGRVYGIKGDGLYRYRWLGSAWEGPAQKIHTGFNQYGGAAFRNKITIDRAGDIFLVDGAGRLLTYRYDEVSKTWPIFQRTVDGGWEKYDLIVAGEAGVIYARKPNGELWRYRYDAASQRLIGAPKQVGSGWNIFPKGMFSMGGDTLFGIKANGQLLHYRYREDTGTWVFTQHVLGDGGWEKFSSVLASTDACRLTAVHTPARPPVSRQVDTPTAAIQSAPEAGALDGKLEFAYTDSIGRLMHGRLDAVAAGGVVTWRPLSDNNDGYTGKPALATTADGRVQLLTHHVNSDHDGRRQSTPGGAEWAPWADFGGAMKSAPVLAKLSDNNLVAFALDAAGAVWARPNVTGELGAWRRLGGPTAEGGLSGGVSATPVGDRAVILVAADAAGTLRAATYRDGALTAWTSLGGTGFTGTPATVVLPGPTLHVFVRNAEGRVVAQAQTAPTGAGTPTFPGTWKPVGDLVIDGSPAAILDPVTGRIDVIARAEGAIHYSRETRQGSTEWDQWHAAIMGSFVAATDPTILPYSAGGGYTYAFLARDRDHNMRVWGQPGTGEFGVRSRSGRGATPAAGPAAGPAASPALSPAGKTFPAPPAN